jgi:hypothetical protein
VTFRQFGPRRGHNFLHFSTTVLLVIHYLLYLISFLGLKTTLDSPIRRAFLSFPSSNRPGRSLPEELLGLIPRLSGMTRVQPILPIHHHVVTDIIHLGVFGPIRLDIDILKVPVETWGRFTTIDLDDPLAIGVSGKVFQGDVGPFKSAGVGVQASLTPSIGQADCQ